MFAIVGEGHSNNPSGIMVSRWIIDGCFVLASFIALYDALRHEASPFTELGDGIIFGVGWIAEIVSWVFHGISFP
jgi:hypothetical protein